MNQLIALIIMVVCLLPTATAIKCYQCDPDPQKAETCAKPTNITTCEAFYDSCMTTSITMNTPYGKFTSTAMNCGLKAGCSGSAAELGCKAANSTGWVTKCTLSCCSEDLCNNGAPATTVIPTKATPTKAKPTSTGQRAVAHFGAILATAVLSFQALSLTTN